MIRPAGGLRSALIIGGQGIRARKLRTLLSMLSLFLGVLAVVVVQAGAETAERRLLSDLELTTGKDGTRQFYLPGRSQVLPAVLDVMRGRADAVGLINTSVIIGEPGVTPVNPGAGPFEETGGPQFGDAQVSGPGGPPIAGVGGRYLMCDAAGRCTSGPAPGAGAPDGPPPTGRAVELGLVAMTGDVRQFKAYRPVSGQWLDFSSAPSLAPRIVLNKAAAKGLHMHRVPAEMRVNGATTNATPRIIGVVDDGVGQPTAYVRTDELFNWLPVGVAADPNTGGGAMLLLSPSATDVERVLRTRLQALGVPVDEIHIETINARKEIASQLAMMRWIFLGMAGLVLLIGVAGVLNVGLATVGERVEEFALRRAVGTPRSLLAGIVLAETLLTGLFTAAAAIGVAALGLEFGSGLLSGPVPIPQDVEFPWQAAVAGVIAGLTAGLLGGLVPAIRAARIPIATVMRA